MAMIKHVINLEHVIEIFFHYVEERKDGEECSDCFAIAHFAINTFDPGLGKQIKLYLDEIEFKRLKNCILEEQKYFITLRDSEI